jgi:hypothetical protein
MLHLMGSRSDGAGPVRGPPGDRRHRLIWIVLVVLALVAATFAYIWAQGQEGRALRALPEAERHGLYLRTMENLRTICDPAPGRSLRDFCRTQAELAVQFPECDEPCREISRRQLSLPRR